MQNRVQTNADMKSIGPLDIKFSEILINKQ